MKIILPTIGTRGDVQPYIALALGLLKAYLQIAPGARSYVSVDKDAPLDEFEKAAAAYPVFKVNPNKESNL